VEVNIQNILDIRLVSIARHHVKEGYSTLYYRVTAADARSVFSISPEKFWAYDLQVC
jgi:hypothetical protein